jgi:hypothetical protein
MCERCEALEAELEEIQKLMKVLDARHRTEEELEDAAAAIPNFTAEELGRLPIMLVAGMVAFRLAGMVWMVEEVPISMILGQWAGMAFESEVAADEMEQEVGNAMAALHALLGDRPTNGTKFHD